MALGAVVGAIAPNHPVESARNARRRVHGGATLSANRAAKRLDGARAGLLIGGAPIAFSVDAVTTGEMLTLSVAALASFVAISNLCVPSMIFVSIRGELRSTRRHLVDVAAVADRRAHPTHAG